MKKSLLITLLSFLCLTCDDGDIITVEFDFDNTFRACGDIVFYKTKTEPAESLSMRLTTPVITLESLTAYTFENGDNINPVLTNPSTAFNINGSNGNTFNYRRYNTNPQGIFCNDVPPGNIQITEDQEGTGAGTIFVFLLEDDNDGIPAEFEDENLDGDNDPSTNPTDRDGDGIPDYLDDDDDGDNVRTVSENPNYDPVSGTTTALDTDGDGIPNYLDDDDDGDGVLTRDEEIAPQNQNPTDDITNNTVGPDYLNPEVANQLPATAYRAHIIQQAFEIRIEMSSLNLPNVLEEPFDFGMLEDAITSTTRTVTPTF